MINKKINHLNINNIIQNEHEQRASVNYQSRG